MATVDHDYEERYSHATVSRWENGVTGVSEERLVVFARALGLSDGDLSGLLLLAGFEPERVGFQGDNRRSPREFRPQVPRDGQEQARNLGHALQNLLLFRALPLFAGVGLIGTVLLVVSWSATTALVFCMLTILGGVLLQGLLVPPRGAPMREFFWGSLFFLLSSPSLRFAGVGADPYGFYRFFPDRMALLSCLMVIALNLAIAIFAGLLYEVLWRSAWRRVLSWGATSIGVERPVVSVAVPVIFTCLAVLFVANLWVLLHHLILLPVFGVVMVLMLVVGEGRLQISRDDARLFFVCALATVLVGSVLGLSAIALGFNTMDFSGTVPDHNIFGKWEFSHADLGMSLEDYQHRLRIGFVADALSSYMYMVFVMGWRLLAAIYRSGVVGQGALPTAEHLREGIEE